MNITEETVDKLAVVTNLAVSHEEKIKLFDELKKILDYVEHLNDIDTEGIEPMSYVLPTINVFREDTVENENSQQQLLYNAPQHNDGRFVVPKTVD